MGLQHQLKYYVQAERDVSNHKQDAKKGQEVQQEAGKCRSMFERYTS
jgi:hypothetical protein